MMDFAKRIMLVLYIWIIGLLVLGGAIVFLLGKWLGAW